ncbi:hypothetical protein NDU88_001375 [Pleurodeles waltl]|uniref:Uncharacterized protein n=1 Tax=Pleurodeles waltl TaxID=8319 RepID=A0AAV7L9A3_PLEWA|nr:hypothetical protein NDU88_001375 [Pleurodeles waltl]
MKAKAQSPESVAMQDTGVAMDPMTAKQDKILAAIEDTLQDLGGRVDSAEVELGLLGDDKKKLLAQV